MKCNFPQKRTVYELSAIQKNGWSGSKKSVVLQKLLNKNILFLKSTFFESPITHKPFIFEHSYMFHIVNVKRVVL